MIVMESVKLLTSQVLKSHFSRFAIRQVNNTIISLCLAGRYVTPTKRSELLYKFPSIVVCRTASSAGLQL